MHPLDPTILETLPPFDRLPEDLRARAQAALDIVYAPRGERLAEAGEEAQGLWIIVKGMVREEGAEDGLYGPGEVVGASALLAGQHACRLIVEEELIAHWLPAHVFRALAEQFPGFLNFFREDLETKRRARAQALAQGELTILLHQRLGELALDPLPRLQAPITLGEAACALSAAQAKALLLQGAGEGEFGLLTQSDVVAALAETQNPGALLQPKRPLIALSEADDLFAALQTMLHHHIHQLVVWRADGSAGLIRQQDILSLVASHTPLLDQEIERATSFEALQKVGEHLFELVRGLHGRGVRARHISAWVSELNAKLYAKVWTLLAPEGLRASSCLFLLGSEGRGEQLLRTDQDNALVLDEGSDEAAAGVAAERLVEALERLGLPRCPGGIMASNPLWRQTVEGWRRLIREAVLEPHGEALLRLAMLADARAVAGSEGFLHALRAELHIHLAAHPTALARMARQILAFETPLSVFSGFVLEKGAHRGQLDLKKGGLFPIMHGVRVYALEAGLEETNTFARIERLQALGRFEAGFARDLAAAYDFMQSLRLSAMLKEISAGRSGLDGYISPNRLDHFEQDLLRDALRTVERFKRLVHHHFRLHLLS